MVSSGFNPGTRGVQGRQEITWAPDDASWKIVLSSFWTTACLEACSVIQLNTVMRRLLKNPICAGLFAAYVIHVTMPHSSPVAVRPAAPTENQEAAAAVASSNAPAGAAVQQPSLAAAAEAAAVDMNYVALLKEPVVILRGNEYNGVQLPKGTPVTVVSREGDFCRVRHGASIVSVPCSALIAGNYAVRKALR